jgi:hypothetical protein
MSIIRALFAAALLSLPVARAAGPGLFYSQCTIFSSKDEALWKFPASLCAFLGDGRFFAQTPRTFGLFDRRQRPVWEHAMHAHHQLLLLAGGRGAATIRSATIEVAGKKVRTDAITLLGLDGKTLAELTLDARSGLKLPAPRPFTWCPGCYPETKLEVTHVNSLQELPASSATIPGLRAGNFLFNDLMGQTIYAADAALKKVVWRFPYRPLGFEMIHDVQLLPNGHLLFYVNRRRGGGKRSAVVELDPATRRVVHDYRGDTPFYAEIQGSVQALEGGGFLLSYKKGGATMARFVDAHGHTERELPLGALFPHPVQSVYAGDLRAFLGAAQP